MWRTVDAHFDKLSGQHGGQGLAVGQADEDLALVDLLYGYDLQIEQIFFHIFRLLTAKVCIFIHNDKKKSEFCFVQ